MTQICARLLKAGCGKGFLKATRSSQAGGRRKLLCEESLEEGFGDAHVLDQPPGDPSQGKSPSPEILGFFLWFQLIKFPLLFHFPKHTAIISFCNLLSSQVLPLWNYLSLSVPSHSGAQFSTGVVP